MDERVVGKIDPDHLQKSAQADYDSLRKALEEGFEPNSKKEPP